MKNSKNEVVIDSGDHENKCECANCKKYGMMRVQSNPQTALFIAVLNNDIAEVTHLLNAKSDVNARVNNLTPLIAAAHDGYTKILQLLLDAKANTEAKNRHDSTALISAASRGHTACVQLLLDAKAYIEAKDYVGQTALFSASFNGHPACVQLLLHASSC